MRLIELIDQCYDKKGRLVSGYSQKKIISSCEDYYTLPGNTFQEKIFLVKNNLTESKKCPVCGKELVFYKSGEYRKYCSNHCKANSLEWKSNRIGKGFQSAEVQKKSKEVLFERYGVSGAAQIQEVKEKIRNTLKKKGQEWRNSEETIEKTKNIIEKDYKIKSISLDSDNETLYEIYCEKHNYTWSWKRRITYNLDGTQQCFPYCIKCHNEKHSKQEKEVVTFIRSIYSGEIIENSRQIIPPKELDIYLPEFKLAIEYCGIAWHSSKFLNKNYHLDKLNLCKEKNIDLLQIWSTEWLYQKDIIKSIIQARLKLNQTKIFARKCIIKELNILEYKKFLQDNHLQGYGLAKIKLGLFCNNELIKVLSFSKSRFNKNYEYELIRECNKLNYQIVGGKQKLLRYFENTYNPKSIISYCNKRLFNGNSYNHFQKKEDSPINYYYLIGHDKLTSRIEFQKHKLNKLKTFDKNLTEEQNMENNGFYRIYDCGNFVFTKKY